MRGHTLVELMIALAVLGILVALAGGAGRAGRLDAMVPLQRERALLLLEYRAECSASGVAPDRAVLARLGEGLPGITLTEEPAPGVVTFRARWRDPRDRVGERSLTVFRRESP